MIQIHRAEATGELYLLNLCDILPVDHHFIDDADSLEKNPINAEHRLRPEFLQYYQSELCADALTKNSGASKTEAASSDSAALKAGRFLREVWIPGFLNSLDSFEIRPFDSDTLKIEMHKKGLNMRYLGNIF